MSKDNLKVGVLYNMYKDSPTIPKKMFYKKLKNIDKTIQDEVYIKVSRYQIKKYGRQCELGNHINDEEWFVNEASGKRAVDRYNKQKRYRRYGNEKRR